MSDRALRNAPRYLTLQRALKVYRKNNPDDAKRNNNVPAELSEVLKPLQEGEEMLYSQFHPALPGGEWTMKTTQTIEVPGHADLDPKPTTQKFNVQAPQYTLPEGTVHSVFPPSGALVGAEILPHVLFTDPYLPWERRPVDAAPNIPWLAVLVFSPDELRLKDEMLDVNTGMFKDTSIATDARTANRPRLEQAADMSLNMRVTDFAKVSSCFNPVPTTSKDELRSNAILCPRDLFALFTTKYDPSANPVSQTEQDLSRYEFLAHVRHSAAQGMESLGDAEGLFSVVLSHRVGPLATDTNTRAVAHLVSLEGWTGETREKALDAGRDFVVLSSLHSWSYSILPTNTVNVEESFRKLGESLGLLRPPQPVLDRARADAAKSKQGQRIYERMKDGYTLVRYQTQTGEETAAIARGAFVPCIPPDNLDPRWTSVSMSGSNMQVFDRDIGLMDITYSTAWSLGKTLALADRAFTTSLYRLRSLVEAHAWDSAKKNKLMAAAAWKSRATTLTSMADSIGLLSRMANREFGVLNTASGAGRAAAPAGEPINLSSTDSDLNALFTGAATERVRHLAGADGAKGTTMFNELNKPNSTDWMIVMPWIMDKMYLFGVPPQYLLPDPAWLPTECLRFFYIDAHWVDAFVDGALSLANHVNKDDDRIRRIIKGIINEYLHNTDKDLHYRPQVPTYGCFLRSHLVKDFPDLHVTAPFAGKPKPVGSDDGDNPYDRAPILRQERVAEDTLLLLFDRAPGSTELQALCFTQPPHQQYFQTGEKITPESLEIAYNRIYTGPIDPNDQEPYQGIGSTSVSRTNPHATPMPFIWDQGARFLNLTGFNSDMMQRVKVDGKGGSGFNTGPATSALVGYQLGCKVFQLGLLARVPELPKDLKARQFTMLDALPTSLTTQSSATTNLPEDVAKLRSFGLLDNSKDLTSAPASGNIAPHIPPLRQELAVQPMAVAMQAGDSSVPSFSFNVAAIDHPNPLSCIPTSRGIPLDLVFSIKLTPKSGLYSAYNFTKMVLQLPMGPIGDINRAYNLLTTYDGPGPFMLTNLRLNVITGVDAEHGWFLITLLPRSTNEHESVPVKRLADCSFLLPLVTINNYGKMGGVTLTHNSSYSDLRDQQDTQDLLLDPQLS